MEVTTHKNKRELFSYKETHLKDQIILCHTSRPLHYYKNSLSYRMGGEFKKIPTYLIDLTGETLQNFNEKYYSEFIGVDSIDKRVVVICLENLGWLKYNQLNDKYVNWIGDIYKGEVYQKRWRDRTYWSHYPDKQIEACAKLVVTLCETLDIPLNLLGHNVHLEGVENFRGIVTRSNYNELWTDLSPSFNFEKLKKYIDYEKSL